MKLSASLFLLTFYATVTFGQTSKLDSLSLQLEQKNGIGQAHQKIDSIHASFYQRSDSLKEAYKNKFSKMDSVQQALKIELDSLKTSSSKKISLGNGLDSIQSRLKNKMDSLKLVGRSSKITNSLDSINTLRDSTLSALNIKLQSLKDKTVGKLTDLNLPPEFSGKVSEATSQISGFQIPASELNISSLNLGKSEGIGKFANLNMTSPLQNPGLDQVGELKNINGDIAQVSDVAGKVGEYGNEAQELTKGNVSELKELPKTAETKVEEISGLNEVKGQTQGLDEYKALGEKMQNPDSLKEFAAQEVKKVAVNHFAGKEQLLKEAMETLAKYKSKYSSLNSISEIKKRRPNEMKGKPFIERVVPGIGIQVQKKGEDMLVDFNPYTGYRFTGRITAGLGWNQRVAYNFDKNRFNREARIYGPRVFGEYKLWKGFSPRAEIEVMNTNVPPITRTPAIDPFGREWVWGAFVGVKKEYRFIKKVKGTALVMIRTFNPDHKSPYGDVVNVRFGFEFPMKKKTKIKH